MILYSKPLIEARKTTLTSFFSDKQDCYIAILFFGVNPVIETYVKNKVRFGGEIGCEVRIFGQRSTKDTTIWDYDPAAVKALIWDLNEDNHCMGIIIQLPLPDELRPYQQEFCDMIDTQKDIDCMGSAMLGRITCGSKYNDCVYPAAVGATAELLSYYNLDNLQGKQISIIGQSNLVGKPMALYCMKEWASVYSFNEHSDQEAMRRVCTSSDYIISASGVVGLVNDRFIYNAGSNPESNRQVLIDIWYGFDAEGKAAGDMKFDELKDIVYAISPVPWWVGALCVCQLFENVRTLQGGYKF